MLDGGMIGEREIKIRIMITIGGGWGRELNMDEQDRQDEKAPKGAN